MRTILDDAMWLIEGVDPRDGLYLHLTELISQEHSDKAIAAASGVERILLQETRALEPTGESRKVLVQFNQVVAWQAVDEGYTAWDDYEERDDDETLQIIHRSKYLDYFVDNHARVALSPPSLKQYRVWTPILVIDVVSSEQPIVKLDEANS